jgi:hypothetical protein
MLVIHHTEGDLLRGRLQVALEVIVRCDIRDPDEDFVSVRQDAHRALREIEAQAQKSGYELAELYNDVVCEAEGFAEYEAERAALG